MKFKYVAVDKNGRPVRGFLEAPDELTAKEMLLDATIFPKQLEPADPDAKVTWRPPSKGTQDLRDQIKESQNGSQNSVLFTCETYLIDDPDQKKIKLTLRPDRITIAFSGKEPETFTGSDVETCKFTGLIQKQWDFVLISGTSYSFFAGRLKVKPELIQIHQRVMTWLM